MEIKQGERWIVFYTDGSTFCSVDGSPWDAPRRSVQSIASSKEGNDWYNVNMRDYYYYERENGGWNEANDLFTVFDHLIRAKRPLVLFGRMLSDAGWRETHKKMRAYCEDHRPFLLGQTDERPKERYI